MAYTAYTTSVYPYPAAMWDEAYEHLQMERGWSTALMAAPTTTDEAVATAKQEMANRGLEGANAIVFCDTFTSCHCIRVSLLVHLDPRWDEAEEHLKNHSTVAFVIVDQGEAGTDFMEVSRAAMLERGLNVAVGLSIDPASQQELVRLERA